MLKRLFTKGFANSLRVGWFLAIRQISHAGKGTTALIIFIMTLTFLNLVVVSGLLVGLISGSFQQFREAYAGEVIITTAPGWEYIENSPGLVSYLKNNPRVRTISARYGASVEVLGTLDRLPQKNERTNKTGARLTGINLADEEAATQFSRFITYGKPLEEGDEDDILIGANLLKQYSSFADANIPGLNLLENVDIGKKVRVSMARKDGTLVEKDFIVKGIIKSKVDEISTRMFIVDSTFKRMLSIHQNQFQEIAVRTDLEYAPELVSELKSFMGSNVARIQTMDEAIPSFLRQIETTMSVLGNALSSIGLVVASITVFIVIFINAVTKRKYIGIMKGIGITPLAIHFSYILQALFYGLAGSSLGLLLTFGLLKPYFAAYPINFPFSDGILVATPRGAAIRVAILLIVTILAGYLPAKLIVRRNTLDAILGR